MHVCRTQIHVDSLWRFAEMDKYTAILIDLAVTVTCMHIRSDRQFIAMWLVYENIVCHRIFKLNKQLQLKCQCTNHCRFSTSLFRWKGYTLLKTNDCNFDNIVVTGGTVSCHKDYSRCRQWRQRCGIDDLWFSMSLSLPIPYRLVSIERVTRFIYHFTRK